jgi:hypothetical protein
VDPRAAAGTDALLEFKVQPKVPFYLFHPENVLRIVIPWEAGIGDQNGHVGTVEILDAVIFYPGWARWGVGPVVQALAEIRLVDLSLHDSSQGTLAHRPICASPAAG